VSVSRRMRERGKGRTGIVISNVGKMVTTCIVRSSNCNLHRSITTSVSPCEESRSDREIT